jgi:hypothetical protein
MRNYTAQLWLGAWLLVLPFLGVPGRWKEILTALTALVLIGHALALHRRRVATHVAAKAEAETLPPDASSARE